MPTRRDMHCVCATGVEQICAAQVMSAGADGLVKLWGVRSSECTATFDEHEGKVWALAVAGENDAVLATGGADACVNIWRDCTAEDEATAVATRTQAAVKAQELSNALQVGLLARRCEVLWNGHCQVVTVKSSWMAAVLPSSGQ